MAAESVFRTRLPAIEESQGKGTRTIRFEAITKVVKSALTDLAGMARGKSKEVGDVKRSPLLFIDKNRRIITIGFGGSEADETSFLMEFLDPDGFVNGGKKDGLT